MNILEYNENPLISGLMWAAEQTAKEFKETEQTLPDEIDDAKEDNEFYKREERDLTVDHDCHLEGGEDHCDNPIHKEV